MRPQAPCKNCEKREFGCHDRCDEYKVFKEDSRIYNLQLAKIHDANVYFEKKAKDNANKSRLKRK